MTDQPPPDEPQPRPTEELPGQPPAAEHDAPPPPHRPLPPQPAPAPAAPAAFPQVLKTPWVNPARRTHVVLVSVLALLVVAAAAFVAGLAVGNDDHHDRGPGVVCPMLDRMNGYPLPCVDRHGWICAAPRECHGRPQPRLGPPRGVSPTSPTLSPSSSK